MPGRLAGLWGRALPSRVPGVSLICMIAVLFMSPVWPGPHQRSDELRADARRASSQAPSSAHPELQPEAALPPPSPLPAAGLPATSGTRRPGWQVPRRPSRGGRTHRPGPQGCGSGHSPPTRVRPLLPGARAPARSLGPARRGRRVPGSAQRAGAAPQPAGAPGRAPSRQRKWRSLYIRPPAAGVGRRKAGGVEK